MYLCVRGYQFCLFLDFSIIFWNSVVFFFLFHFILTLISVCSSGYVNDLFSVFLPTSKRQYCKINKHMNVGTYLYFYLNYDRNVAGTKEEIKIQKMPQPKC